MYVRDMKEDKKWRITGSTSALFTDLKVYHYSHGQNIIGLQSRTTSINWYVYLLWKCVFLEYAVYDLDFWTHDLEDVISNIWTWGPIFETS